MGLFDQFPYTNFHELNLMWILEALKEIQTTTEQFVAINSLKYADPIQWNITSQYEKNTIVIDPQSGTAYISVQPVPTGVALTNEDYWTVVFDLGSFVTRAAKNFTHRYEEDTTLTATFNSVAGDWLVWGDTLYIANVNITAGDSYVVDGNIKRITVEEVKDAIYETINDLSTSVDNRIGILEDLTTTDKSNLVAAINEVLTTLVNTSGDLEELTTTDKSNLVAAINEINSTGGGAIAKIGDLEDLTTTDKSNLVAAVNEVNAALGLAGTSVNVKYFGAVGDAIYYNKADNLYYSDSNYTTRPTNDYQAITQAIQYAIDNKIKFVYFPSGSYYCGDGQFNIGEDTVSFIGDIGSELISEGLTSGAFITLAAGTRYQNSNAIMSNITLLGNYFVNDWTNRNVIALDYGTGNWMQGRLLENVSVARFNVGIYFSNATELHIRGGKIILCDNGLIFEGEGTYNPMPAWIDSMTIELNARGIFATKGGYSTLFLSNCGLSGGSQLYIGYAAVKMTNCRMEFALHECCDKNGSPVPPIDIVGDASSAISGISFVNCQFLFTYEGVNAAKLLFWTGNVYTRNSEFKYIIDMRNAYNDSPAPITFDSCEILPGSAGCNCMVQENQNDFRISYANMKTAIYNGRCVAFGSDIMGSAELPYWDPTNISYSSDVYTVSAQTTITLPVPRNATAISMHIEPINDSVYAKIETKAKDNTYTQNSIDRNIPANGDWTTQTLATKIRQNVETVDITIGAGSFSSKQGEFWIEFVY